MIQDGSHHSSVVPLSFNQGAFPEAPGIPFITGWAKPMPCPSLLQKVQMKPLSGFFSLY
jgi:hypothetical protein